MSFPLKNQGITKSNLKNHDFLKLSQSKDPEPQRDYEVGMLCDRKQMNCGVRN